ncbi:MAG: hypothetical protein P8R42_23420 [Candidatus Binatia bacterium]|nr:hypothetical protein [Candidatus Binatia bacterium]
MNGRMSLAAALSLLLLGCSGYGPPPAPIDEGAIFTFAPVGPQTFLVETDPAELDRRLRGLIENGGPDDATRAYANRWVQPPGWKATVEAFGEPTEGDLYGPRGYRYRTNLVHPASGVIVLAYTKQQPDEAVWKQNESVQVSGRLEGYVRQAPGIVILLDAKLAGAPSEAASATPLDARPG